MTLIGFGLFGVQAPETRVDLKDKDLVANQGVKPLERAKAFQQKWTT